jgi:hypothetical protein
MACPTCNGHGMVTNKEKALPSLVPCPNPDCPDRPLPDPPKLVKGAKVVNIAPNQDWSGLPVVFGGDE